MIVWVDADACPTPIKEILFRAADRTRVQTVLVANHAVRVPKSPYIKARQVERGFDVADARIVTDLSAGDLVQNVPAVAVYDGTNFVVLNPQLGMSGFDTAGKIGYRNIPSDALSGSHTAVATDVGRAKVNTTGGWTINNSVFAAGDTFMLVNNSGSSQTVTQGSGVTLRLAGSSTTGNRTLAQRGIAMVYAVSASEFLVSGAGVS